MRLALALIIGLAACSSARAADPWGPILDLFRRKPVPTLPAHPPDAPAAIERALIDAELQAAIKRANEAAEKAEEAAKEAARIAAEQVRDSKSPVPPLPKPKARPQQPLSLAAPPQQPATPADNDGRWLAPCFMVCGYVHGKSQAELDASEIEWRVSARQKAHGDCCIILTCQDAVAPDALKKMKARRQCVATK